MDAGHRHELKTNELAESLGHLPQLIKENTNFIIGIALVAIGLLTWPMFTRMSRQKEVAAQSGVTQSIQMLDRNVYDILQAPQDDAASLNQALSTLLVNADALLGKASDIDNPNLAALARIKAAQAIRTELHLRKDVSAEMLESQIQKARTAYEEALQSAQSPELKAMAKFGLGLCAEELGQTAQAADIYKAIIDDKAFEATVLPKQARQRLDSMEENSQAFTFAPAPVKAPAVEPPSVTPAVTQSVPAVEAAPAPTLNENKPTETATDPTPPSSAQTPGQAGTEP